MIKKLKYFIENKFIDKRDIKLIILTIIALILLFFNGSSVFASTNYNWSSTKYEMTVSDLYALMNDLGYNVEGEDFSAYEFVADSSINNNLTLTYQNLVNDLISTANTLMFSRINYNEKNLFCMILLAPNDKYASFNIGSNTTSGSYYMIYSNRDVYIYIFDLDLDKIFYGNKLRNSIFFAENLNLGTMSWFYNNLTNTSTEYFSSLAYQQNLFYDSFYLVNGLFNYTNRSILNQTTSFKVTESSNGNYLGDINYSLDFEKWLTNNLSDSFLSGEYSYYIEQYFYSSEGLNLSVIDTKKICDVSFTATSVFAPTNEQIINTIKSFNNYEDYVYTITLNKKDDTSEFLLSSELIIINVKPISIVPYFVFKYNYISYPISSDSLDNPIGGDLVVNPSGDSTNLGGGISGIWQAITNLPKTIMDGLIGLFVPDAEYFFNESIEKPGLWQRFSEFFSSKLGFLWDVVMFIPNLVNTIIDIIANWSETWTITIPDLSVPAMTGVEEYVFLESFEWSPYDWINQKDEFKELYDLYLDIIDFFVYWGLVWFAVDTLFLVFGNSDNEIDTPNN